MVAQTHAQDAVLHLADRTAPSLHISAQGGHILSDAEIDADAKHSSKVGQIRLSDLSQFGILQPREAYCDYCGKPFQKTRANQKYCSPSRERLKQFIRKETLIIAWACHMEMWGWSARDLLLLARQMVESAFETVKKAMEALGWRYVESKKMWHLKPSKV